VSGAARAACAAARGAGGSSAAARGAGGACGCACARGACPTRVGICADNLEVGSLRAENKLILLYVCKNICIYIYIIYIAKLKYFTFSPCTRYRRCRRGRHVGLQCVVIVETAFRDFKSLTIAKSAPIVCQ